MNRRTVFFISDRTGITAETLGHSLITQFEDFQFEQITLPFVDTLEKAHDANARIAQAHAEDGARPVIFATIIQDDVREVIQQSEGFTMDFVQTFIGPLEAELGEQSSHTVGRSHGVKDQKEYNLRIESVNFALQFDDGMKPKGYDRADVILVGVSRSGKTPTCLYMAMQFGIRAANYPLTEEDLEHGKLPPLLEQHRHKLVGLTIEPKRLQSIRAKRRPDSSYAENDQCLREVRAAERLFQMEKIPFLNSTTSSIEEMASKVIAMLNLKRVLK